MEVVGVDGPDDDAAEALGEDVVGLEPEAFFIVVAEPLVSSVAVGTDNLLILKKRFSLPPFFYTSFFYWCFAQQMVLLGSYHDSSLFTSPVTCIHAGAREDRHFEREKECMLWGYPRR